MKLKDVKTTIINKTKEIKKAVVPSALSLVMALSNFGVNNIEKVSAASYETAYFPGNTLQVTQGAYNEFNAYSHQTQNAFDFSGNENYTAPFTGKIVSIYPAYNVVALQSIDKVYYADGTLDYMTVCFVHDNNISDLWVGKTIKQGTVFYQPGVKDPTGKTTGKHLHLAVKRGRINSYFFSGDVYPSDALWIKKDTVIKQRGGYAWSKKGNLVDNVASTLKNGGVYTISPAGKSLYLHESGTNNLSNVDLSSKITNASKWKAVNTSKGWYFQNVESGKVLDLYGSTVKSSSNVQIYTYNQCSTEYFHLKANGDGSYIIQTLNKRVAVDCCGSSSSLKQGSNIWCYGINYDSTQLFNFKIVG